MTKRGGCFIAFTLYFVACCIFTAVFTFQNLAAHKLVPGIAGILAEIVLPFIWWNVVKPRKNQGGL